MKPPKSSSCWALMAFSLLVITGGDVVCGGGARSSAVPLPPFFLSFPFRESFTRGNPHTLICFAVCLSHLHIKKNQFDQGKSRLGKRAREKKRKFENLNAFRILPFAFVSIFQDLSERAHQSGHVNLLLLIIFHSKILERFSVAPLPSLTLPPLGAHWLFFFEIYASWKLSWNINLALRNTICFGAIKTIW